MACKLARVTLRERETAKGGNEAIRKAKRSNARGERKEEEEEERRKEGKGEVGRAVVHQVHPREITAPGEGASRDASCMRIEPAEERRARWLARPGQPAPRLVYHRPDRFIEYRHLRVPRCPSTIYIPTPPRSEARPKRTGPRRTSRPRMTRKIHRRTCRRERANAANDHFHSATIAVSTDPPDNATEIARVPLSNPLLLSPPRFRGLEFLLFSTILQSSTN